ncbi:TIGR03618 family F420-dependent PPOX class oxidoreductase [Microbacterium sp. LMI1-1-1.1]|uniref:TIGR03618 family F420-dependent PPOX class oxidoreductase n=1 Tax=unclassified Microbacterium TaxID=2609290 RepID=UPI0034652EFE
MSDWTTAKPYFETTAVAHLSTLMKDGAPHSVPVWVGVEGERLAFFTEAGALKDRNLQRDPRVAVSVTKPDDPLAMAFVRGTAVERLEGAAALEVVDRISTLYTGEPYPIRENFVAWLVEPGRAWGRAYDE